jgi:hypothetical protein
MAADAKKNTKKYIEETRLSSGGIAFCEKKEILPLLRIYSGFSILCCELGMVVLLGNLYWWDGVRRFSSCRCLPENLKKET